MFLDTLERGFKKLVAKLVLIYFLIVLTGCANFNSYSKWKTRDKLLFGSGVVLNIVDTIQTNECANRQYCYEVNPLLQKNNSKKPDMTKVIALKGVVLTGQYLIFGLLPIDSKIKTGGLSITSAAVLAVVVSNFIVLGINKDTDFMVIVPVLRW